MGARGMLGAGRGGPRPERAGERQDREKREKAEAKCVSALEAALALKERAIEQALHRIAELESALCKLTEERDAEVKRRAIAEKEVHRHNELMGVHPGMCCGVCAQKIADAESALAAAREENDRLRVIDYEYGKAIVAANEAGYGPGTAEDAIRFLASELAALRSRADDEGRAESVGGFIKHLCEKEEKFISDADRVEIDFKRFPWERIVARYRDSLVDDEGGGSRGGYVDKLKVAADYAERARLAAKRWREISEEKSLRSAPYSQLPLFDEASYAAGYLDALFVTDEVEREK